MSTGSRLVSLFGLHAGAEQRDVLQLERNLEGPELVIHFRHEAAFGGKSLLAFISKGIRIAAAAVATVTFVVLPSGSVPPASVSDLFVRKSRMAPPSPVFSSRIPALEQLQVALRAGALFNLRFAVLRSGIATGLNRASRGLRKTVPERPGSDCPLRIVRPCRYSPDAVYRQ